MITSKEYIEFLISLKIKYASGVPCSVVSGLINQLQNSNDINYVPMSENEDSIAFKAARDLVFEGIKQPSGYTEPILHRRRLEFKSRNN